MKKNQKKVAPAPKAEATKKVEPKYRILGTIGYDTPADLENLSNNMSTEQAVLILISAVNLAQAKGAYTLAEASLISNSIKRFMKPQVEATAQG